MGLNDSPTISAAAVSTQLGSPDAVSVDNLAALASLLVTTIELGSASDGQAFADSAGATDPLASSISAATGTQPAANGTRQRMEMASGRDGARDHAALLDCWALLCHARGRCVD